jgi:hypothetical protein
MELSKSRNATKENASGEISLAAIERALAGSWSAETSALPGLWTKRSPALGQCAVTALVVQDYLGGKLLRVDILSEDSPSKSHYYNELPDGSILDLTMRQFSKLTLFGKPSYREREYVLSYPETAKRYELLKTAVTDGVREQMDINIRKE